MQKQHDVQHLEDYLSSNDGRDYKILYNRFSGKTLEAVGAEFGISRERARQIEKNFIKNNPIFKDDAYSEIFKEYNWTLDVWIDVFKTPPLTYHYLNSKYKHGHKNQNESLNDERLNEKQKHYMYDLYFCDVLIIDDIYIPKNRKDILAHLVENYCKEGISVDELEIIYRAFIKKHKLDKTLLFDANYFRTALADGPTVLRKRNNRIRVYDFSKIDPDEIVQALKLDTITNARYSSLKFFREYPEMMQKWDIRDEYELHNLIKKVVDLKKYGICAGRMPTLKFGNATQEEQLKQLINEYTPAKRADLARLYEERYGVRAETILSHCFDYNQADYSKETA